MVPISSGAVSSPVDYIDVTLPSGYDLFILRHTGFKFSAADAICAALSSDGGATFHCDTTNFDTYGQIWDQLNLSGGGGFTQFRGGSRSDNSVINSGIMDFPSVSTAGSIHGSMTIYPGNSTRSPTVDWETFFHATDTNTAPPEAGAACLDCYRLLGFLNPVATSPPSLARINLIRLLPYGNGDCAPPTSGETITSGTYHLFGAPTP